MRTIPVVTLVECDDWEGMYVDGVLKEQGHRVSLSSILAVFGLPPVSTVWADSQWVADRGDLPERLTEVERET